MDRTASKGPGIRYCIVAMALLCTCACEKPSPKTFQGYVEGEFVYVASPLGGRLETLNVRRGHTVKKGDPLFVLERALEEAVVREASQKYRQAMDRLANLKKGKRPSEIQAITAKQKSAQAGLELAQLEYDRRVKLSKKQFISQESLDRARTEYRQMQRQVQSISADLKTARLGARLDEIKAAEAEADAVSEQLVQAQWNLDQKTQAAQKAGLIFDTYYYSGEWVPPGRPVISLLPPENVKIRFFVPEKTVGRLSREQKVFVSFDGGDTVPAHIAFISPRAQYTPPVIYSSQTRAKLVFMIEAAVEPAIARRLHPGQPVDVAEAREESGRE
ncbi:MAG TPA: HlyD family efflux transporter periplasmic adaptor subunit [Desulfobacteria bacterium]|nr:HlyD family efflux transporter periplasmic adaptor subunit [Desulfobacteria bacterium]